MKWFKHFSDANSNLKILSIMDEFGNDGYAVVWICRELIAQQGNGFYIPAIKGWKKALGRITKLPTDTIERILDQSSTVNLIDKEALSHGDLFIPKMAEYCDEYTEKKMSRQTPDNVGLDKIRLDKIRLEENRDTPAQLAKKFFSEPETFNAVLEEFSKSSNIPAESLVQEAKKFGLYWTELNKSGTKQRWETEKTFEVKRRLFTWFSNVSKFNKTKSTKVCRI